MIVNHPKRITMAFCLSARFQDDQLYFATDAEVVQMSVAQCQLYSTCALCLQDPHCGWSQSSHS